MYDLRTGPLRWAQVLVLALLATALTAVVAPSPAQAAAFATAPGATRTALTPSPIGDRTTTVYRPQTAGANAPLVILLHGRGGTGAGMRDITNMDSIADRYGFVTAYPDADQGLWNAGPDCCRNRTMPAVDDVAFLHGLADQLAAEDQIDRSRVYAVGLSAGGILSYKWACERPGDLRGIGVTAGVIQNPCPAPAPLNVVAVHGDRDKKFPAEGGTASNGKPIASLDQSIAPFLAGNGCPTAPVTTKLGRMSVATWSCTGGRGVVRSIVQNEAHTWPGYSPRTAYPKTSADTSDFIWTRMTATYV